MGTVATAKDQRHWRRRLFFVTCGITHNSSPALLLVCDDRGRMQMTAALDKNKAARFPKQKPLAPVVHGLAQARVGAAHRVMHACRASRKMRKSTDRAEDRQQLVCVSVSYKNLYFSFLHEYILIIEQPRCGHK